MTSASSCSRSRWYSSSRSRLVVALGSARPGGVPGRGDGGGACSPPFLVAFEKAGRCGRGPRAARSPSAPSSARAFVREPVAALRRAGRRRVPLGADEPSLLERAQQAVEVAHVDARSGRSAPAARVEQLVAVGVALAQSRRRRLGEALDAGADAPAAAVRASRARATSASTATCEHTCKTHVTGAHGRG